MASSILVAAVLAFGTPLVTISLSPDFIGAARTGQWLEVQP
jgi:hypothetical protein